jgi:hypothetical protein
MPVLDRRLTAAPRGPIFTQDQSSHWLTPTLEVCPWYWHDLRRGYITAAHRAGIDPDVARALTNHIVAASDAHGGYVVLSADAMRADARKVADFLLIFTKPHYRGSSDCFQQAAMIEGRRRAE